jgi:hypothetical protein
MALKPISIEINKVFAFRTIAFGNLVKQFLEFGLENSDNLILCLSYALKLFQQ